MGNCMRSNNKVSAANEKHEDEAAEYKTLEAVPQETPMPSLPSKQEKKKKKKNNKAVRFNLQQDHQESSRRGIEDVDDRDSKTEVVRIRLVVTQEELKQLLNYKKEANQSSFEELLSAVKSRGTAVVSQVDETSNNNINGYWMPSLESIPEDQ